MNHSGDQVDSLCNGPDSCHICDRKIFHHNHIVDHPHKSHHPYESSILPREAGTFRGSHIVSCMGPHNHILMCTLDIPPMLCHMGHTVPYCVAWAGRKHRDLDPCKCPSFCHSCNTRPLSLGSGQDRGHVCLGSSLHSHDHVCHRTLVSCRSHNGLCPLCPAYQYHYYLFSCDLAHFG